MKENKIVVTDQICLFFHYLCSVINMSLVNIKEHHVLNTYRMKKYTVDQ